MDKEKLKYIGHSFMKLLFGWLISLMDRSSSKKDNSNDE
jgi:hypothetical protein